MINPDFRALCEELADGLDEYMEAHPCRTDKEAYRAMGVRETLRQTRDALAQSKSQAPTDEELGRRFRVWWHNEGSGLPPLPGMDHEEHARRISEIAWANGGYAARWVTPANTINQED